ncbi:hypothetical protein J2847_004120 [Azospirillum agricola]|uniref:terminase small subunit n=1 Tax=Azospirillum agricola TaxID=1720247 RepID=UPI001AE42B09|nr:terminase small subunit [Azospirillum agricola]MBP2230811.1 hypothetical protein [Azospirillum agricola]
MALTPKKAQFAQEYLVDLNATRAATAAGYSARTAKAQGARLLTDVDVQAAIQAGQAKRSERTAITADRVLVELWGMATADTNELVEHRVCCCRFCWGKGHLYQRTPNEMRQARAAYERDLKAAQKQEPPPDLIPPFDEAGGEGFNATREPHPNCPECFGEGHSRPVFRDSTTASAGAKALYAGVKTTRDGLEMKLHPKDKALELLGRHLGMWNDKLEMSGELKVKAMSDADLDARIAELAARGRKGGGA